MKGATILVYDGWGRGEEKNFASREEWLQEIASWFIPPPDVVADDWDNLSRTEIMAAQKKRDTAFMARLDKSPVSKRAVEVPIRLGSDVYICSWPKQVRVAQGDLIGLPIPVHHLSADLGPPCSRRLAEFQPEELNPTAVSNVYQFLDMCKIAPDQPWMYCLDRSWSFQRIEREAVKRKWHKATKYNLKIESPRQYFWRIVLELEESLHACHLKLSPTLLRAFWTSWQVAHHLDGIRREIEKYAELPGAVAGQTADIGEAVTMIEQNLRSYGSDLWSDLAQSPASVGSVDKTSRHLSTKSDVARAGGLETKRSKHGAQPVPETKLVPESGAPAIRDVSVQPMGHEQSSVQPASPELGFAGPQQTNMTSGYEIAVSSAGVIEVGRWEDIKISLLSDHSVEIRVGKLLQVQNYAEMGFVDRRTGKPNNAWGILRVLAQSRGELPNTASTGVNWLALEKQIERTRKALQKYFRMQDDPLPRERALGYRARFKIECAPSFHFHK